MSCGVLAAADAPAASEPTPEQLEFFEKKIRPVFADMCYKCHSTEAGKSKGGLLLDSRAEILKGGETGPALVAGDPEKSLLIKAIRGDDKDMWMPPKGEKLKPEQIADVAAWIKMGAPMPKAGAQLTKIQQMIEQAKDHWAFQPVKAPVPPKVKNDQNAIDGFILAGMKSKNLKLAKEADKRTLIRRAYFDLTGLPPSNDEIAAFVADKSKDAYEKLIDKLLASPQYGERWGRHWLDVARYADTMGAIFGGDDNYAYAYSYRDYVVRAFNDDMPYDRFVQEQLAGDFLCQGDDNRPLAAMGYLTVGRRKDRSVDDEVYDDRIDTIARGLMGMTVACARCHDHKLEPIPSKDYYGLYAILRSSKEPEVYPEMKPVPETPEYQAFIQERDKLRKAFVEAVSKEAEKAVDEEMKRAGEYLLAVYEGKNEKPTSQNKVAENILKPRKLHDMLYMIWVDRQQKWFTANVPVFGLWSDVAKLKENELAQIPDLVKKHSEDAKTNPRLAQLLKEAPPKDIKEVAALYGKLFNEVFDATSKLGQEALTASRAPQDGDAALSIKELENAVNKRVLAALAGATLSDANLENVRKTLAANDAPTNEKPEHFRDRRVFTDDQIKALDAASKPYKELETKHAGAPPRAMALKDGDIYDGKVFLRGNPNTQGEPAPRKFLTVLSKPDAEAFPKKQSGRLELAKAIASKDNPLTARVFVNRVWAWHFGEGIVRTPSDFGFRGEKPTHPELLDYLTDQFVSGDWSTKKLHKLIMMSATYRQSSVVAPEVVKADPENKLWARMNGRVLEFEAFRDAQLSVAGRLTEKKGGRAVDLTKNDANSLVRSLYGSVDRKLLPNLYRSFDFPDPNFSAARRSRSALTPQALFLLNSGFEVDNARALAEKVRAAKDPSEADGIKRLYRLVLQRDPNEKELKRSLAFLASYPKDDIVKPEATDWTYGRGKFDIAKQCITEFTPLAYYTGKAWQTAQKAPDKLALTAEGGETGSGSSVGAIRRWIAPLDGKIKLSGELEHPQADNNGVVARVIFKNAKMLGEWRALHNSVTTALEPFEVKKGDSLDFVVSGGDQNTDHFQWAPTITMVTAEMPGMPGMPRIWDAKTDFMDIRKMPKPIGPWEELAQVLLLSNEFMFVD